MKKQIFKIGLVLISVFTFGFVISAHKAKGSGCVNGPNVTRYCFNNAGIYECKDNWIWNCITEVNEQ
jgi:hypothetical protein